MPEIVLPGGGSVQSVQSAIGAFLRNKVLEHMLRGQAYTPPSTVYLSLHSSNPGTTGANEISGGSYVRQARALNVAVGNIISNSGAVDFPVMPAAGVAALGIWDAESNGNFLWGGDTTVKTTNAGDTYEIPDASLTVSIT